MFARSISVKQFVVGVTTLIATNVAAQPILEAGEGTPPLTWHDAAPTTTASAAFLPVDSFLHAPLRPVSARRVSFHDAHPYGEQERQDVWLARYDAVPIAGPDSSLSALVALSLVFKAETGELLCAFTDPSPAWARSAADIEDIEAAARWKMYPARYEQLQSTVPEVLSALWMQYRVPPTQAGQIIVRPRFNNNEVGPLRLVDPPCNIWMVEVLGRHLMTRRGKVLTRLAYAYRDGDLKGLFGTLRP